MLSWFYLLLCLPVRVTFLCGGQLPRASRGNEVLRVDEGSRARIFSLLTVTLALQKAF